jgi:hypothetical protein
MNGRREMCGRKKMWKREEAIEKRETREPS